MEMMTLLGLAAQPTETATNSEAIQIVILFSLMAVLLVALSGLLAYGALLPPDEPQEPTRADVWRGWVLLLVLEVQAAVAIVGAL